MPGMIADRKAEALKIQTLINSDIELKEAAEDFEKKYEIRKKIVLASEIVMQRKSERVQATG